MLSTISNKLGDINPQLLREIKGRLKPRNIFIVSGMSLVSQVLMYFYFQGLIPTSEYHSRYSYCEYKQYSPKMECLYDSLGNLMINRQLWWLDMFITLSIIATFTLLVVGTYMVINDLAKEDRKDTLGFIRFSPQTPQTILTGKILGVPVLLYLFTLLGLPLHLIAGLNAQISFPLILSFYGVLITSCFCCYSGALLFGFVGKKLLGFQPWLGSGAILFFLFVTTGLTMSNNGITHNPVDWLSLFHPGSVLPYLVDTTDLLNREVGYYSLDYWSDLKWLGMPLWQNAWTGIGVTVLNYGIWTYWIWQGLKRCFRSPQAGVISKVQSYWLTGSLTLTMLGFTTQARGWGNSKEGMYANFATLFCFSLIYFLGLISALSPHRQTLIDWARYRHQEDKQERKNLWQDLLTGEKSPATLAIAVNLLIGSVIVLPGILSTCLGSYQEPVLLALLFNFSIIMIYTVTAQLILLTRWRTRAVWSAVAVISLIILPLVSFAVTGIEPHHAPGLWLFSAIPVIALEHATSCSVLMALLGQCLAITLGSGVMVRQISKAGESEMKALVSAS